MGGEAFYSALFMAVRRWCCDCSMPWFRRWSRISRCGVVAPFWRIYHHQIYGCLNSSFADPAVALVGVVGFTNAPFTERSHDISNVPRTERSRLIHRTPRILSLYSSKPALSGTVAPCYNFPDQPICHISPSRSERIEQCNRHHCCRTIKVAIQAASTSLKVLLSP